MIDRATLLIFVGAVLVILFLFVLLFIYIVRMARRAKLQTKIALMHNQAPEDLGNSEPEKFGARKSSIKKVRQ